jgi:hypothetical protein
MIILGALIALTNITVEVIKSAIPNSKFPTNLVAVIVAIVITVTAFAVWASISNVVILWWHIVASIIVGVLVAYGAMFGYDKLKEVINSVGK